jgi:DUF1680 family protein
MNVLEVDLHKLTVSDPFLGQYQQLVRDVVIPYQWDALNDRIAEAEPSHAIENFRIAAGLQDGEFYGMVFQDSDVAKWLEAVAWSLCQKPDASNRKLLVWMAFVVGWEMRKARSHTPLLSPDPASKIFALLDTLHEEF